MAGPDLDTLSGLMDEAKCFALVRQHRWPDGVRCPACGSGAVIRDGHDETQPQRQRYRCKTCAGRFDDLTGTVVAGHKGQPAAVAKGGGLDAAADWRERRAAARWRRRSHPSSA